ncbi:hypothetical protein C8F04DRAFT_1201174 [Mycena alexandri]|uniref:Uncharacterized protein n=1 Tax=Mycena alexandri TaxID=1745969 RepID=A0AAD6RXE1_9AGAR|nr:hypothetical protein C8F04DRAFT_1201174 [Mycena alexandri]
MEISKSQTLQREQKYPVFTLADLELSRTLNPTNPKHTRVIARLVPHQKLVMLRQYHSKSTPELAVPWRVPAFRTGTVYRNGAGLSFNPAVTGRTADLLSAMHSPVQKVIKGLYRKSPRALQREAIEIITGVLDGMNHLRENGIALADLVNQLSNIQYDGTKVILNVELPKQEARSTDTPSPLPQNPVTWAPPQGSITMKQVFFPVRDQTLLLIRCIREGGVLDISDNFWRCLQPPVMSVQPLFNSLFQIGFPDGEVKELFGLPENIRPTDREASTIPSALWPIWWYLMGCDLERRLHDLRNIIEKLYGPSSQVIDIPQALIAAGNFPYQDFPPTRWTGYNPLGLGTVACLTKSREWVTVCDILGELRDEGIISIDPFISTYIDDDDEQANPDEEVIRADSGIFSESVGDYTRYKFWRKRPFSLEIGRATTTSLHDPAASETRRRIQEYFHERLPSLLEQNSWICQELTEGFVLVTSVSSRRTSRLTHDHDTQVEAQSQKCLQCMTFARERPQPAATGGQNLKANGVYFHAMPEQSITLSGPVEHDRWGRWTISIGEHEIELEPPGYFSHTYEQVLPHSQTAVFKACSHNRTELPVVDYFLTHVLSFSLNPSSLSTRHSVFLVDVVVNETCLNMPLVLYPNGEKDWACIFEDHRHQISI